MSQSLSGYPVQCLATDKASEVRSPIRGVPGKPLADFLDGRLGLFCGATCPGSGVLEGHGFPAKDAVVGRVRLHVLVAEVARLVQEGDLFHAPRTASFFCHAWLKWLIYSTFEEGRIYGAGEGRKGGTA